jgi:hypothetical protein
VSPSDVESPEYDDSSSEPENNDDDSEQRDPLKEITETLGRLNVGEDGQLRYFGSQSNFHLIHGNVSQVTTVTAAQARARGLAASSQLGWHVSIPIELQNHLLDLYWRWQNPWVYMVQKESFMPDFLSGDRSRYCTPVLLSVIFALASRYSDRVELRTDPEDPKTAGNAFSEQARVLLMYECEAATTATVQAAALMSLRMMSENKETLGWLYIGEQRLRFVCTISNLSPTRYGNQNGFKPWTQSELYILGCQRTYH